MNDMEDLLNFILTNTEKECLAFNETSEAKEYIAITIAVIADLEVIVDVYNSNTLRKCF